MRPSGIRAVQAKTTYLETLERTNGLAGLDGLCDRGVEGAPVIERADSQELDKRVDLLDVILPTGETHQLRTGTQSVYHLHGSTGEAPPVLRVQRTATDCSLRGAVLDVVSLIYPDVSDQNHSEEAEDD